MKCVCLSQKDDFVELGFSSPLCVFWTQSSGYQTCVAPVWAILPAPKEYFLIYWIILSCFKKLTECIVKHLHKMLN